MVACDPSLQWNYGLRWQDFLLDNNGSEPATATNGRSRITGHEPDKSMSKRRDYEILIGAGIATSTSSRPHGAMVAPGYEGCGEPCMCLGHPPRHTAGLACDLNKSDLQTLKNKLTQFKAGSLDDYLKQVCAKNVRCRRNRGTSRR